VTFDPRGDDVALSGTWTVDGAAPTTASCSAAGITHVAVAFFEESGGSAKFYDDLRFPCEAGSFTTVGPVLARGRYTTQWFAFNGGTQVGSGMMEVLDVTDPSIASATLRPVNFISSGDTFDPLRNPQASLTGDWVINGGTPDAASCADVAIDTVAVVFYAEDDTSLTNGVEVGMAPCVDGKFDSMTTLLIGAGRYQTTYRAYRGSEVVAESMPLVLIVTDQTRVTLAQVDFVVNALDINVTWDTDDSPVMAESDCAGAGVVRMTYTLSPMGMGTVITAMEENIACANVLRFEDLTNGTYQLYLEGEDSMMRKLWMETCDMIVYEGGVDFANCPVMKLPAM
jgi:hypothetical protein